VARYDASHAPDPDEWLDADEAERVALVVSYHRVRGIEVPNMDMHARFHALVETSLAEDDPAVADALQRLTGGGLDRHEAVHAIGYVMAQQALKRPSRAPTDDPAGMLAAELRKMSAPRWRRMG
jgi:hypothetical protein